MRANGPAIIYCVYLLCYATKVVTKTSMKSAGEFQAPGDAKVCSVRGAVSDDRSWGDPRVGLQSRIGGVLAVSS